MTGSPPLRILVAALGGEGGGVLLDWIVTCAQAEGLPVQATSVPGVAQRTGATSYYAELLREPLPAGAPAPVFALTPIPGQIDLLVASELLEAARMLERGFVNGQTTLVGSTHRVYTTLEKMQPSDGRFDAARIEAAAQALAGRSVLFDMDTLAQRNGTVVSAVMFGGLAGTGLLPWPRERCIAVIRASGRGAAASIAGFEAGYAAVVGEAAVSVARTAAEAGGVLAQAGIPSPLAQAWMQRLAALPAAVQVLAAHGAARCRDYQDDAYAAQYLDRLAALAAASGPGSDEALAEAARHLALWMCFEDIVRVADLKTRPGRYDRVRSEAQAQPGTVVRITEHFKPGVAELCDLLPRAAGTRLHATAQRRGWLGESAHVGLHIRSTSLWGYLLLRGLARLRPMRRRSLRYGQENEALEAWLQAMAVALARSPRFALALAGLPQVLKGYGETQRRGREKYARLWTGLVVPGLAPASDIEGMAATLQSAVAAALNETEPRVEPPKPRSTEQAVFWAPKSRG